MSRNGITQWGWREMEELLQCPVCLDIPSTGIIEQCGHGHHICASCKRNVEQCPLCKCAFYGTRNFILEELVRHFEIVKNAMLLNNIVIENKTMKRKAKKDAKKNDPIRKILKSQVKRTLNTPPCTRGIYPCRAPDCNVSLPLARILNHCRTSHSEILTESEVDYTNVYTGEFEVPFRNNKPITKDCFVIFVCGIGLVYLNFEILKSGQLIVFLQMALKFKKCQEFLGSLTLFSNTHTFQYNTRLVSTRINLSAMMTHYNCFTLNQTQFKKICANRKFSCKLTLSQYDASYILTEPNRDEILVMAGIRASLHCDISVQKLIEKLDGSSNKKPHNNVVPSTSQDYIINSQPVEIEQLVPHVLRSLNLEDARSNVSGNATRNRVTESSSSTNVSGARNKKKKHRKSKRH